MKKALGFFVPAPFLSVKTDFYLRAKAWLCVCSRLLKMTPEAAREVHSPNGSCAAIAISLALPRESPSAIALALVHDAQLKLHCHIKRKSRCNIAMTLTERSKGRI